MCGILGAVQLEEWVDRPTFAQMLDTLKSRGPDGCGMEFLAGGHVALGHRRLAIIDLSDAGKQPIANEDGSIWLVFNGEIYNFESLRGTLASRGHRFRSRSDSEVIVHAYEEWGDNLVRELRGIFAFGLWDERSQRLLLIRDHLGVKPLYYWSDGNRFVFSSQPRGILAFPQFAKKLSRRGLQSYLAYGYVADDLAIYEGMSKVPAGHRLTFERGRVRCESYWAPQYRPVVKDSEEATELIRMRIQEAVRMQTVSDVPIGVSLSGGIDSSTVAALVSAASADRVPSFTIGFNEPEKDERHFAQLAADLIGTKAIIRTLTMDRADELLPQFIEMYDEPFYDGSGLPTYAVSELAREHGIKVILGGDGADELFAGYYRYVAAGTNGGLSWFARVREYLLSGPSSHRLQSYFDSVGMLSDVRQCELLYDVNGFDHLELLRRHYPSDVPPAVAAQLLDLRTYLVDDILTKVDRASMACGVEVRVPLLDHMLVESVFSIDSSIVFAGGERKALLKRAISPWVPAEILTTRKKGFSIPTKAWMDARWRQTAMRTLVDGSLVSRRVFSADRIGPFLERQDPFETWLVLVAELWARRWLEGEDLREMHFDTPVLKG